MPRIIQLSDLAIRLGGRDILRGVNVEIQYAEFVGVFGPNGAGKSTLMRCLLGLVPYSGEARVFGEFPGRANRRIGYMPQARAQFENIALSARSLIAATESGTKWGIPWNSEASRVAVDRVLWLSGAEEFADRPYAVLSGGEKQRIHLAQSLLGNPQLLILDEPLMSLDPKNQARMIETVARIKSETGAAVLFVAHDINPLIGAMDRVLYVAGGSAAIGPVEQVISGPELSKLYGTNILVVRAEGRIFIVAEGNVTETEHEH